MIDMANNLTGFIVLVATLGIAAQWLAWRFRLPAILLLSIAGLVVGPWLGWINPSEQLGTMLEPLVGCARGCAEGLPARRTTCSVAVVHASVPSRQAERCSLDPALSQNSFVADPAARNAGDEAGTARGIPAAGPEERGPLPSPAGAPGDLPGEDRGGPGRAELAGLRIAT